MFAQFGTTPTFSGSNQTVPQNAWVWHGTLALCCLCVILPVLLVSFPPAMDLPQHVSQLVLFSQYMQGSNLYVVHWFGPNNLIYAVIALVWLVAPTTLVGKITLMLVMIAWTGALFWLARKQQRPLSQAILASLLVFNFALYWGFLNFLIGWPIFIVWFQHSLQPLTKGRWLWLLLLTALLYSAHVLWFLVAGAWLLLATLWRSESWRLRLCRLSVMAPLSLVVLFWYPRLASTWAERQFNLSPEWTLSPLARSLAINQFFFGGLYGWLEPITCFFLFGWLGWLVITQRQHFRQKVHLPMLTAAAIFLALGLFGPDKYMNTVYFAQRWIPMGVILLWLALPEPKVRPSIPYLQQVLPLLLVVTFALGTTYSWRQFEHQELSGLSSSLMALSPGAKVVGLDFVKKSAWIKWLPFTQLFANAQAMRGASLNFSFAEHASMFVQYQPAWQPTWTLNLQWRSEAYQDRDLQQFDYVLVNGDQVAQAAMTAKPYLQPITTEGRWRLYRVNWP